MKKYKNLFSAKNKTILINGGLGLLGSEIAQAFLSMDANVIILDTNKTKKNKFIREINSNYLNKLNIIITDTSQKKNIEKIFNNFKKNKLKIDTFINCSYPKDKNWPQNNFKQINHSSLIKNINLNVTSYVWLSKIVADYMSINFQSGSIILLSSIYGMLAQNTNVYDGTDMKENLTYNFIKGGLINYCRSMAANYGKLNVRINCISPGGILGPVAGKSNLQDKKFIKNYLKQNPIKRLGKPEDVASMCIYLSSEASSYINGANIVIDGGWSII